MAWWCTPSTDKWCIRAVTRLLGSPAASAVDSSVASPVAVSPRVAERVVQRHASSGELVAFVLGQGREPDPVPAGGRGAALPLLGDPPSESESGGVDQFGAVRPPLGDTTRRDPDMTAGTRIRTVLTITTAERDALDVFGRAVYAANSVGAWPMTSTAPRAGTRCGRS
jgi:hypothetical protein